MPKHSTPWVLPWWRRLLNLYGLMTETPQETRRRANVVDTNAEVMLLEAEARMRAIEAQNNKTPHQLAAEKLPMVSVAAVTFMVSLFFTACFWLDSELIAVLTALTGTVVSSFIGILRDCLKGEADLKGTQEINETT